MRNKVLATLYGVTMLGLFGASLARGQQTEAIAATPSRILQAIDDRNTVTLKGHVLRALTPDKDLGLVEESLPVRLYLSLQRTPAQQADLDALIAAQQNPKSAHYHQWLTPEQFGARFGASESDIQKIHEWLESQGFEVTSVAKNKSVINVKTTAAGVRETFHAQLHYWNIEGGKYVATANEPQIPAALAQVVAGIAGLNQLPHHTYHTPIHQERYDADTHKWYTVKSIESDAYGQEPHYLAGDGHYNMTPQDYYTIYNANPTYTAGNHGEGTTIAIIAFSDFNYGTVSGGTAGGTATGGDAVTFRNLFGITNPLNLKVQHGNANFPCSDPGINSGEGEFALDTEWSGALAPAANIILSSCGNATTGIQAIVDDNVADVISSSIGIAEALEDSGDRQTTDTALAQAATQGQTYLSAQGDSGSDDYDFGASQGTHGLSIDYPGSSPLVLSIGGTDFQDTYDSQNGGVPQSTYWSATNSQFYGDALGYVPEMTWNESCGSPFIAFTPDFGGSPGESTATYCNGGQNNLFGGGGGGGISSLYAQPSWQIGIPGLSASITNRVTPDVSMFASGGGYWGHGTVLCDSTSADSACTSPSTFGGAGGTSFAAPEFAGILGLLRTGTGSRQGLVQPALYALAKAQYTAGTACYANGHTANTGITTGLPASTCIFHDVTTSGNNNECEAGTPNCFTNPGASYGVFTSAANTSTFIDAYAAGAKYDIATGLGSVNVTNMINMWNTAFTSSTALKANPTSINSAQSTTLTATVTGGTPPGYTSPAPALTGSVNFYAGSTKVGSCTLSGGTCFTTVNGSAFATGSNSVTATFVGSGTYPSSTSSIVTVTVTASQQSQTITFGPLANKVYGATPFALTATASSGLPVSYTVTGPATVSGSTLTITGAGSVTVTAMQAGNSTYAPAPNVSQSFTVSKAVLTATAASFTRAAGTANPTLTYAVTGFVNNDPSTVVGGSASLTTTATTSSPAGTYPITFSSQNLTATNYTFTYVAGTLTVTSGGGSCTTINYGTGFTATGLSLNGGATINGTALQLTDSKGFEARSAFYTTIAPVVSFTTDFTFQVTTPIADGLTFTIQSNNAQAVGGYGVGLGYAGIGKSVALKFDLYNNSGEGANSTGVYVNGAEPTTPAISLTNYVNLHSGHVFHVHISYANAMTTASITDTSTNGSWSGSINGDITQAVGKNAYIGFTGGTGTYASTQKILTWSFSGCPQ